jgi:hypothetical protein
MHAAQNTPSDQQSSGGLITLRGNTRPEAKGANDRGRVADDFPMNHMLLLLRRTPEQEQALEKFINDLHDPSSAAFHHWITAEEFGRTYGVAAADISRVTDWLESQGFRVNLVYPNRLLVDFTGTAGQVRQAFHTEIHHLMVNGQAHIANMSDPKIPEALGSTIKGIVSLNDFRPRPMFKARADYNAGRGYDAVVPADVATIYNFNPLFAAGISGQGQTIVLLEDTDLYTTADWSDFRSTFGLAASYPSASLTQVHPSSAANNCTDPGVNMDDAEAAIDVEWASAGAPNAQLVLASCNEGLFVALQNLLNASGTPPPIVSISYGESESALGASFNAYLSSLYQQAVTAGVSIFVSSGDSGAEASDYASGITVSGFTSTPYNVSVGGTDFADTYQGLKATYWNSSNAGNFGSALSYVPEIPWNDSCASVLIGDYVGVLPTYGSGGLCNSGQYMDTVAGSGAPSGCATGAPDTMGAVSGTCAGYPKPSWQSGLFGNPSDGVRDVPDVSLFAANGAWDHYYVVCYSDPNYMGTNCSGPPNTWSGFGGTSVSSPIMAAIQALANQESGSRWGNPNPTYYALANSEYGSGGNPSCLSSLGANVGATCVFYDVAQIPLLYTGTGTGGDNNVVCSGMNCYAPSGQYGVLSTAPQTLSSALVTYLGSGYTSAPSCTLSGGGGTGATCSASVTGVVSSVTVTNGGSGFTAQPVCTLTGGGGTGATCVAFVDENNEVANVFVTNFGSGYTSAPTCTINRGYGGGATCSATVAQGIAVSLTAPGSGYTSMPYCALSGGGGTGGECAVLALNTSDGYKPAFAADNGWDFATGIGTVNAANLVGNFSPGAASLSSSTVSFASQPVGTSSGAQTVTVTNTGTGNLAIVTVTLSGPNCKDYAASNDTCTGATLLPNGTCTVGVTFTPTTEGDSSASLSFTDIAPHSPQTVTLSGTGTEAVVGLSPASLTFTGQLSGTSSAAQSVIVKNTGNATLTISGITVSGDFSQTNTCAGSINAGASCTISVTFKPTAGGTRTGAVSIADNSVPSPQTIPLSGAGQDFTLAPPSGSTTTATVSPGQSATYTLSIAGEGGMNQAVNFTCTGAPSEATCSASPNPVTPGSSATNVTVTVTTTPPSTSPPPSGYLATGIPRSPGAKELLTLALLLAATAWVIGRRRPIRVSCRRSNIVLLVAGLLLALALVGCGGGGNPGTPAGTYVLTLTGATGSGSPGLSHSVNVTLNVT